jgi:D-sedoheptulose 7-phosphate isomerase
MEINSLSEFVERVVAAHRHIDTAAVNELLKVFMSGFSEDRIFFTFGNGGSGAAASHFCEDLGKGTLLDLNGHKRFRVMSLADNTPYILAWANDHGYETIFEQQLRNFGRSGDIAIGISGSGNSVNVLKAVEYARDVGMVTVGFTGFDGGKLGGIVDYHIHVPCDNTGIVESVHGSVMHYLVMALREKICELYSDSK